jgi:hypothetical protein
LTGNLKKYIAQRLTEFGFAGNSGACLMNELFMGKVMTSASNACHSGKNCNVPGKEENRMLIHL